MRSSQAIWYQPMSNRRTLAIIGGGVAGLCAAFNLQEDYEITLFEKQPSLGGNNHSGHINDSCRTPMGVILFPNKDLFYHTLYYAQKFSLPLKRKQLKHVFMREGQIAYSSNYWQWPNLFNLRKLPRDLRDFYYLFNGFRKEAHNGSDKTIVDLINEHKLSEDCAHYFLLPFASLYLSMPYESLLSLPVHIISAWWKKYATPMRALSHYNTIDFGNHQLIDAFCKNTKMTLKCATSVQAIYRQATGLRIQTDHESLQFDRVLLATPPDEALRLIQTPSMLEQEVLSLFDVGEIMSTLHTNDYGAPDDAMTLQVMESKTRTHLVSRWNQAHFSSQTIDPKQYVSIHQVNERPIMDKDIREQITFRIPQATPSTLKGVERLKELNAKSHDLYFCGSYANPFFYHEDAIQSALDAKAALSPTPK